RPNQSISRAEFATMLVKLFGLTTINASTNEFVDVEQHWARDAIEVLSAHGIVNGYRDGTFKPYAEITREEMIVLIMRIINVAELPQAVDQQPSDLYEAGQYAQHSITSAVHAGIIKGYTDQSFRPKNSTTRAEAVSLL